MSALIEQVAQALAAGATIGRDGEDLVLRGPRSARPALKALSGHKADVLSLVDSIAGRTAGLNWRDATVGERSGRCVLCRRWALLRDPRDGQPMHKVCAEQALRRTAATTSTGVAA